MRKLTTFQAVQAALFLAIIAFAVMFVGYSGSGDDFRKRIVCPIRTAVGLPISC